MKTKSHSQSGSGSSPILVCAVASSILAGTLLAFLSPEAPAKASHPSAAGLTFAERVAYQYAIEEVYWRHRIWPEERPDAKPSLDTVMCQAQLENKVTDYLHNSQMLEEHSQESITAEQLQAEMDRMAQHTRQPEVLRELFEALGNDPFVIAECLARPVLAERLVGKLKNKEKVAAIDSIAEAVQVNRPYQLPAIAGASGGCIDNTWTATSTINAPSEREYHTAVWTGTEMIVWGGFSFTLGDLNTGGRYNPSTDSWRRTSTTNAPSARSGHTAVWTGSEMIVWGGYSGNTAFNTGERYDPGTDTWAPTSTTNAPSARSSHTAVWTGSEMIVWGGYGGNFLNTGGRYNPSTDSWRRTTTANAPSARSGHSAVWTGSEMIVWGGNSGSPFFSSTGGRYNPTTDSWTATTLNNAPAGRAFPTAIWTGNEMIVWGGSIEFGTPLNTGGRYNPSTDSWTHTSISNAPSARRGHTAVWTGSEMIVWGGRFLGGLNTGGRYNPSSDSWIATSTTNAPTGRYSHTAVWTNSEMIVSGGTGDSGVLNTGGRYCAATGPPNPSVRLGNISTRAFVQTGDNVMIGGFIVQGTGPKRVIIRAIGPELGAPPFNVPNALADPTLELHDGSGALIATNDNWQHTIVGGIITHDQVQEIRNSGHAPGDQRESAIIADLAPGNYTAIVRGENNMTGVALVEVYDLGTNSNPILANISTRSFVQTGDNVMIGGFIVQGTTTKRVIIRAIGPELGAPPFNVPNALSDPTLELHDGTGALIASNDNWQHTIIGGIITSDQVADIRNSGHAPTDGRESAIIANLPPGNYTAIVRGVDNTGVALVEVYDLDR